MSDTLGTWGSLFSVSLSMDSEGAQNKLVFSAQYANHHFISFDWPLSSPLVDRSVLFFLFYRNFKPFSFLNLCLHLTKLQQELKCFGTRKHFHPHAYILYHIHSHTHALLSFTDSIFIHAFQTWHVAVSVNSLPPFPHLFQVCLRSSTWRQLRLNGLCFVDGAETDTSFNAPSASTSPPVVLDIRVTVLRLSLMSREHLLRWLAFFSLTR